MKITFRNKSVIHVAERTDMFEAFPGKKGMIENMKKAVNIAKPRIKRRAVEEIKVVKGESIGKTFKKFLTVMESVRNSNSGHSFRIIKNGEFVVNMHYYLPIYDYSFYLMSLEWLPDLRKKDIKMHNLLVDTLRFLGEKKGIRMICDLGFYETEQYLSETLLYDDGAIDKETYLELKYRHAKKYHNKYEKLLNKPGVNYNNLITRIREYPVTHPVDKSLQDWCTKACDLAWTDGTMDNFIEASIKQYLEYNDMDENDFGNDGYPLYPNQWLGFVWIDDIDYMDQLGQWMGDTAGNFGVLEYDCVFDCATQCEFRQSRQKHKNSQANWLMQYIDLLEKGMALQEQIKNYMKGLLLSILTEDETNGIRGYIPTVAGFASVPPRQP
jgi:hypothetical protein